MNLLRTKAIELQKRDDRVHAKNHEEVDRIEEIKGHLMAVMEYMRRMTEEMAIVLRLTKRRRNVPMSRGVQQTPSSGRKARGPRPRKNLVCVRCETAGHNVESCWRTACLCGSWHNRSNRPLPSCVKGTPGPGAKLRQAAKTLPVRSDEESLSGPTDEDQETGGDWEDVGHAWN